jgi:hypothetical protein
MQIDTVPGAAAEKGSQVDLLDHVQQLKAEVVAQTSPEISRGDGLADGH